MVLPGQTIVVWFSCGAASAIAVRETIRQYGDACTIRVVNNPIAEENEDNRRFLRDVESWLGVSIDSATNSKFPACSAVEVWEKEKFMSGPKGAPCTRLLKKAARQQWEANNHHDWMVMGFCADEIDRANNFRLTERANLLTPVIAAGITHKQSLLEVMQAGILLPQQYRNGFNNANCEGCVKATSPTYWNHVRQVTPEVFHARAEQSRRLGARLVRHKGIRIFLDELPPGAKGRAMPKMPECGLFCEEKIPTPTQPGDARE